MNKVDYEISISASGDFWQKDLNYSEKEYLMSVINLRKN